MYNIPFSKINKNEFLDQYWQKAPCFFKNAFADPPNFLSADELAGLSLDEEIESRLVIQNPHSKKWSIEHGAFNEDRFSQLAESHWTLLVQSVDVWAPQIKQLLVDFNFIPRWRFDDVMLSFATEQGGVGPHADNYDVFLIQGSGSRHWRVGAKGQTHKTNKLIDGMRHLNEFEAIIDVEMQPGDMLYIPPDCAHWGISIGESMGYSVGYRSIQTNQMLALLTENLSEQLDHTQFFTDTYRKNINHSNHFEHQVVRWAQDELINLANQPERLSELLAKQLSHSKLGIFEESNLTNIHSLKPDAWLQLVEGVGVNWRPINNQIRLNIEGESFDFEPELEQTIETLASFEPFSLKSFTFSSKLVDFSPVLVKLLNRGYLKLIKSLAYKNNNE